MKLSTKGRYGVRLMIDLAAHYGEGPVLLREIAKREEISEKYLSNLVNPLKSMGLVEATRGVHGGYVLGKAPTEITMKEVSYSVGITSDIFQERLLRRPPRQWIGD